MMHLSLQHQELLVEALAEIKATVDGESDQSVRDIIYGLLAEIKALPTPPQIKHLKRGSTYDVIGEGEAQISMTPLSALPGILVAGNTRTLVDGMTMIAYRSHEDGKLYFRFPDEFHDPERFEKLP